ncbi:unnamed protein product [Caretta caretta]
MPAASNPVGLWVGNETTVCSLHPFPGFFHYHEELNNSVRIVLSPKRQEAEFHASHSRSHITSPSKILGSPYSNVTDQLPHIKSCLHQEWLQLLAQVGGMRKRCGCARENTGLVDVMKYGILPIQKKREE